MLTVGVQAWKVKKEISRKAMQPTEVPSRATMKEKVAAFREISGNGIIVDREGRTLCAVFSGKFGVPPSDTKPVLDAMQAWKEDETARVPPPQQGEPRKRSYDQRHYVSFCDIVLFTIFTRMIIFAYTFVCRTLPSITGGPSRPGEIPLWGSGQSPRKFWKWRSLWLVGSQDFWESESKICKSPCVDVNIIY